MDIKKYMKENVDWKFFNFIVDASTEIEDTIEHLSFNFDICVYLNGGDRVIQLLTYTPRTGKYEYLRDYAASDEDIMQSVNDYGLTYYIELYPVTDDSYITLYQYFDKIKHRCKVVDEDQFTIKVKPL